MHCIYILNSIDTISHMYIRSPLRLSSSLSYSTPYHPTIILSRVEHERAISDIVTSQAIQKHTTALSAFMSGRLLNQSLEKVGAVDYDGGFPVRRKTLGSLGVRGLFRNCLLYGYVWRGDVSAFLQSLVLA